MKRCLAFVLFCTLASICLGQTSEDEKKQLFEKLDQNQDGKITKAEIDGDNQKVFDHLLRTKDSNQDGELSLDEFVAKVEQDKPTLTTPGRPQRPSRGQFNPEMIFKRLDKDRDGKLTADEFPEERREMVEQRMKQFGVESMSLDQFQKMLTRSSGQGDAPKRPEMAQSSDKKKRSGSRPSFMDRPGMGSHPIMKSLDVNGDGKISSEEMAEAAQALKKLDKNGDGQLTREELAPERPNRPSFGSRPDMANRMSGLIDRIMGADKNGDGKLSKEEAPERMQRGFDRIDTNSDGFVEKTEIEKMFEGMRSRFGNQRPGQNFGRRPGPAKPESDRPQRPPLEKD